MEKKRKEPIKKPGIWIGIGIILLLLVPWYLPAGSYEPLIFGFPYWALIVIGMSIVLSAFLSYVIKYHWHIEEESEE